MIYVLVRYIFLVLGLVFLSRCVLCAFSIVLAIVFPTFASLFGRCCVCSSELWFVVDVVRLPGFLAMFVLLVACSGS